MKPANIPAGDGPTTLCHWDPPGAAARSPHKTNKAPICSNPVRGVDEQRTCAACRAAGAPNYIPYSSVVGYEPDPQVLTLANAWMVDGKRPDPKEEVGAAVSRAAVRAALQAGAVDAEAANFFKLYEKTAGRI